MLTGRVQKCMQFSGTVENLPVAKITIRTPFFTGTVDAVVGAFTAADLIVGNFPGVRDISDKELTKWQDNIVVASVETRSQARKSDSRQLVPELPIAMTPSELAQAQKTDSSLSYCFKDAQEGKSVTFKSGSARYLVDDKTSVLYRIYSRGGIDTKQVVVPKSLRTTVLESCHDTPRAGHMGIATTKRKVLCSFHWPTLTEDVQDYCRSCMMCRRTRDKGETPTAPIRNRRRIGNICRFSKPAGFGSVSRDTMGTLSQSCDFGTHYVSQSERHSPCKLFRGH